MLVRQDIIEGLQTLLNFLRRVIINDDETDCKRKQNSQNEKSKIITEDLGTQKSCKWYQDGWSTAWMDVKTSLSIFKLN